MKTIFVMLDSLNRHMLNCYRTTWVHTPNIDRLAKRGIVFDNHWAGSLPCMPARREMMTGRINFLETGWSPIQPWDDTLPMALRGDNDRIYCHMITDHYHYFHSGGDGYHLLFQSYEAFRGQEADRWRPMVAPPPRPEHIKGKADRARSYWANRAFMDTERDEDYSTPRTFRQAVDFLERNHDRDNWHLHVEAFDPHEPFACPEKYLGMYQDTWDERYHFVWPDYAPVREEPEAVDHVRKRYAATLTMADHWLGKFLDKMDALDLWKDTTLIFTTDHGHMLGEKGYWGKNYMMDYNELVRIPLIVCTPETAFSSRRVHALTTTIDLMPTVLDLHDAEPPPHVHGKSITHLFDRDATHHHAILYGYFGKDINLTDGNHTYCRQPLENSTVYLHTLMARNIRGFYPRESLAGAEFGRFLKHTYDIPQLRLPIPSCRHHNAPDFNPLYDIKADPDQTHPIHDQDLESRLAAMMRELLEQYDAPASQFERMGL